MPEDKKNPVTKEKSQDKSSCESQHAQPCNEEDMTEEKRAQKARLQSDAKKNPAQQNTGHKHGDGSCSH